MESLIDILEYIIFWLATTLDFLCTKLLYFSESFLLLKVVLTAVDKAEAISTMEKPAASTFIDFWLVLLSRE